jgi:probable F420-dependent oxidoreductase
MKIGIFLPTFAEGQTPEYLTALAEAAEAVGVASLWAPEHVVLADHYESRYPYSSDGRFPLDPSAGGMAEPLTVLAYLAARTKRARLGTGICLVPQRNPVYTAKQVANVDLLSGGRVDFGVGIGWLAEEFAACGVPFERRAARTMDYLEIMRKLWTEPLVSHESEFYRLPPVCFEPKPVQKPHPPIVFGGDSDAALRRVARAGQGWFGWNLTPEAATERIAALDRELERRSRTRAEISITVCPYVQTTQDLDAMKRYRDAGVGQVVLLLYGASTTDRVRQAVEDLGGTIVEPASRI